MTDPAAAADDKGTQGRLFPWVTFDRVERDLADRCLDAWGHWLGGCNRPFGVHSFALQVEGTGPVSVAVSATTINETCGGYRREEVVELARQASHPDWRAMTRVCLRLWRELAAADWTAWQARALVSYSNNNRHLGHIYRHDGWIKVADARGSTGGGTWARKKQMEPKTVWAWPLDATERELLRAEVRAGRRDPVARVKELLGR